MKYNNLAVILAAASFGFFAINCGAQAEEVGVLSPAPAVETATAAASNGNELEMFRFALEMDKEDFTKKALALEPAQEKKFLDVYYVFNAKLKALNDKRLKVIADYLSNVDKMTDAKAGELAKRTMEFRKQRIALDEKYYTAVAKATSKKIAARAMQVENFLQGAGDVAIGSKLPLMPKK
jgi:hypothetical protein